jgi:nitrogen fixation protein
MKSCYCVELEYGVVITANVAAESIEEAIEKAKKDIEREIIVLDNSDICVGDLKFKNVNYYEEI